MSRSHISAVRRTAALVSNVIGPSVAGIGRAWRHRCGARSAAHVCARSVASVAVPDDVLHHELVPLPESGRRFTATRRVRWGDADRAGRLRLDGVARYLQDVANDDVRDAGHDPAAAWVVRRTSIEVVAAPTVGEVVDVTTWASGSGRCWAERRTTITGDAGGHVETVSLWIFVDPVTGRPARLTQDFHDTWGEATGGRKVPARNLLGPPPDGLTGRRWPLRSTDLDGLGHVNNAATWAPVEDELDRSASPPAAPISSTPTASTAATTSRCCPTDEDGGVVRLWLTVGGAVRAVRGGPARLTG